MTVVGLDDTDSREGGLCTTYVATLLAEAVADAGGRVAGRYLVRLNPAVEAKTRGNAALALHVDLPVDRAFDLACRTVDEWALAGDPRTSPGVVVAPGAPDDPDAVPDPVAAFARAAVRDHHELDRALEVCERAGYREAGWAGGRGRIGALAAVGARRGFADLTWTYERLAYRAFDRCGSPRDVDRDSVFAAAEAAYPRAWDTVDRETGQAVCVPRAPGPVLYGVRGDDRETVERVAARIDSEPVVRAATFETNQGTDVHLAPGTIGDLRDGRGYRVDGVVAAAPDTRRGGHVFVPLVSPDHPRVDGEGGVGAPDPDLNLDLDPDSRPDHARLQCVAFAPTGRFRDRVRALRPGDRVTVCGEYGVRGDEDRVGDGAGDGDGSGDGDRSGALKLEKFAVRELVRTERRVPTCPDCDRSMESAGRDQGYRCRDCRRTAPDKKRVPIARELARGWYEVPPTARRHVAKPLVRGGFDAPTHPER
jgi:tRNA(Ile2)-agmatinylcytidine synthase